MKPPARDRFGRPVPAGSPSARAPESPSADAGGDPDAGFVKGVALFDAQRFFEAHEHFEHVWKAPETAAADRDYFKGITQIAVGCCHVQRSNRRGALAVLTRATRYLERYPSPHLGIDTAALVALARTVADRVRRHGASPELDFPRFPTTRG